MTSSLTQLTHIKHNGFILWFVFSFTAANVNDILHFMPVKKIFITFTLVICTCFNALFAQNLYSKAYGNSKNPSLIFIHGGPGENSTLFEGTTAQRLADMGFFVIVYDRRSEGCSIDPSARLSF